MDRGCASRTLASRGGLTLVEVLVAVTIVALLVGLALPAVQHVRETSRATVCRSNLRQIAFAAHSFHAAVRSFPPARVVPRPGDSPHHSCGGQEPTWFVHLLPYLEETSAGGWNVFEPFASHPAAVRSVPVPVYVCPSRRSVSDASAGPRAVAALPAQAAIQPPTAGDAFSSTSGGAAGSALASMSRRPKPPCCGGPGGFWPFPPQPPGAAPSGPQAGSDPPPGGPAPPSSDDDPPVVHAPGSLPPGSAVAGALGDYAGNHGDLSPGATGEPTSFYFGGNGTGVLIASRATCAEGKPLAWVDRIRIHDVTDGLSNTFLAGERHVPASRLGMLPDDGSIYDGNAFSYASRLAGPGAHLARNAHDLNAGLSFGSWHPDICQFVMADGSVRSVGCQISTTVLGALSNRRDGNGNADF